MLDRGIPPTIFLRLKIWHVIGQFGQEIRSPSAAGAFVGVVARAEVMDRHPLSYLVPVRVWDEGAWAISDRSPLGSAVP